MKSCSVRAMSKSVRFFFIFFAIVSYLDECEHKFGHYFSMRIVGLSSSSLSSHTLNSQRQRHNLPKLHVEMRKMLALHAKIPS